MNIGVASRPKPGEAVCGDNYAVCWRGDGVLIAVVDGLGHGPEAGAASGAARQYIEHHQGESLRSLMEGLHRALIHTRGAAVTLMRIRPGCGEMAHSAVGNVEVAGIFQHGAQPLCVPGVVGYNLTRVVERHFAIGSGDLLVAYTDGVSPRFDLEQYRHLQAQAMADALLVDWGRDHDDATCVSVCC